MKRIEIFRNDIWDKENPPQIMNMRNSIYMYMYIIYLMNMANDDYDNDDDDEADKPINNSTNKIIFIYKHQK